MPDMRAIHVTEFGGPEVLRVAEVPDPIADVGQVVVRVHAAGVNPVDAYIRTGTYARRPPLPYIPGFDGAGVIESAGPGVKTWQPGDRVWIAALGSWHGTYAERMVCSTGQVFALPAHVTFGAGASLGVPAATAHRALFGRAGAVSGNTVLVHGASGAVGVAAVQLARDAGLRVFGTASTEEGRALVVREGAEQGFDHHDAGRVAAIREATGGAGVDIILEMLANVNLDTDLGLLAPRGRVVVIGSRGRVEIDPRQTMGKDAAILGMTLWNVPADEITRINLALTEALDRRALRPVVGREFALTEAPAAHAEALANGTNGKVVIAMP
jgi:NADPH2:quinone reductase